jgi:hypothetical protein
MRAPEAAFACARAGTGAAASIVQIRKLRNMAVSLFGGITQNYMPHGVLPDILFCRA